MADAVYDTPWALLPPPTYLVLPLQHQQVGDLAEGQAEPDDLRLVDVVGQLAQVNDSGRHTRAPDVTFELFAVVAIGYRGGRSRDP